MKIRRMAISLCSVLTASLASGGNPSGDPFSATKLSVLFQESGKDASLWARFSFSRQQDLILNFGRRAGENSVINSHETRLIPRTAKFTEQAIQAGELIHSNGDDATPWRINGTYIGGNHGCTSVIQLGIAEGAVTEADIGSSWKDDADTVFYIIDVPAPGTARFLSENLASYPFWKFNDRIAGNSLTRISDGKILPFTESSLTQLWPCARISEQKFLADGKTPLRTGRTVDCEFVDIIEEYDIINPASVLAEVIRNPGRRADFTGPQLDGVIRNRIIYRISPNASVVISHHATALQPFDLEFMGFIQQALIQKPADSSDVVRYYIPKAESFEQDGTVYDFRSIQDFDQAPKSPLYFTGEDSPERRTLPDRFVQFLAKPDSARHKNRVGFALGYSLTNGLTAMSNPAWKRKNAGFIHTSSKTYPFALDQTVSNPVPAGTTFDCVAYRQYFNPDLQDTATCVFWHTEDDKNIVFIDYHQTVTGDSIRLPQSLVGCRFKVLEKTESISLAPESTIPSGGLKLSCDSSHGYLVLEVDKR